MPFLLFYFNSTLVQLEAVKEKSTGLVEFGISIPLWFNWKSHFGDKEKWKYQLFQFHSGSIGSQILDLLVEFWIYFNSTLVQLEVWSSPVLSAICCISIPLWFNWKPRPMRWWSCILTDFNSTLVQLEARCRYGTMAIHSLFQFHSGSIGSK